jgi:hypothetical protein
MEISHEIDEETIDINDIAWEIADSVVADFNNTMLKNFSTDYEKNVKEAWNDWYDNECYELDTNCLQRCGFKHVDDFIPYAKLIYNRVCKRAVGILRYHLGVSLPGLKNIRCDIDPLEYELNSNFEFEWTADDDDDDDVE